MHIVHGTWSFATDVALVLAENENESMKISKKGSEVAIRFYVGNCFFFFFLRAREKVN